jgi:hypothetical protein
VVNLRAMLSAVAWPQNRVQHRRIKRNCGNSSFLIYEQAA